MDALLGFTGSDVLLDSPLQATSATSPTRRNDRFAILVFIRSSGE
jgi:hypothetical protein